MVIRPLFISPGNRKLGSIPSLSFPPILSCTPDVPCKAACYSMKAWRLYPHTRAALSGNLTFYYEKPLSFRIELRRFLTLKNPRLFRFFVSGDIPDRAFLSVIDETARAFPDIKFLFFTKRYSWVTDFYPESHPANLKIIFSAWPGYPLPDSVRFPIAFYQDGNETRTTEYGPVTICPGSCEACLDCFDPDNTQNVLFYKH